MDTPDCFYRLSINALITNDARNKFLICQEDNGKWELPGGGLDWGATPQEDLPREIKEEMGLKVVHVAERPSYFLTVQSERKKLWIANVLYETTVAHYDFTPSDECMAIGWVNAENAHEFKMFPNTKLAVEMFDPANHTH
jgi:ADP-ribose pyrophosphatase YjhB (NUDIX family)